MTPEQFCYWLQGFTELNDDLAPGSSQWKIIKDHLQTVFYKVTPSYPAPALPIQRHGLKDQLARGVEIYC